MAWKLIPGFLLKDFWFPFANVIREPEPAAPTKSCENLCATTKDCCRWGVAKVRNWEDALDAKKGLTRLGWEVHAGDDLAAFTEVMWCTVQKCAEAGAVKLAVTVEDGRVVFHHKDVKVGDFAVDRFPAKEAGSRFYVFVALDEGGWTFFDRDGNEVGRAAEVDALKNLKEDPENNHAEVTFVASWACGLFKKEARAARVRLESLQSGLLKKCDGHGHESIVDGDKAFAAALANKAKDWSVDASAGSHGISFASVVCAVFASVALVFLVLFVAKKNSQHEVVVADE